MHYQGGKRRIGAELVSIITSEHNTRRVVEPFLGGGGFLIRLLESGFDGEVFCGDIDPNITAMMKAVAQGYLPPRVVITESEWDTVMTDARFESTAIKGFIRFASMFMARPKNFRYRYLITEGKGKNNWERASEQVARLGHLMMNTNASITVVGGSYEDYEKFITTRTAVYCDPPYAGTAGYGVDFDHSAFWERMECWDALRDVKVFVSEYSAPNSWKPLWERNITSPMAHMGNRNATTRKRAHEMLFARSN